MHCGRDSGGQEKVERCAIDLGVTMDNGRQCWTDPAPGEKEKVDKGVLKAAARCCGCCSRDKVGGSEVDGWKESTGADEASSGADGAVAVVPLVLLKRAAALVADGAVGLVPLILPVRCRWCC